MPVEEDLLTVVKYSDDCFRKSSLILYWYYLRKLSAKFISSIK